MRYEHQQGSRKIVVRIHGEEVRRFHADVVVEVPVNVTDDQVEHMWLRNFDGVRDLEWVPDCTTGIWPSNCGKRIQPQVQGPAASAEVVQVRLLRTPKGSVVVEASRPDPDA